MRIAELYTAHRPAAGVGLPQDHATQILITGLGAARDNQGLAEITSRYVIIVVLPQLWLTQESNAQS